MLRLNPQLLLSSEIGLFEDPTEAEPNPGMAQKEEKCQKSTGFRGYLQIFVSYTCRTVFILSQDVPRMFPTDSENMNIIRALFLVENHDFQPKYLSKSTKFSEN